MAQAASSRISVQPPFRCSPRLSQKTGNGAHEEGRDEEGPRDEGRDEEGSDEEGRDEDRQEGGHEGRDEEAGHEEEGCCCGVSSGFSAPRPPGPAGGRAM